MATEHRRCVLCRDDGTLKGFGLEIHTFCNARCIMCPYPLDLRPKKIMPIEFIEKIIKVHDPEGFTITGVMDALAHPHLWDVLKLCEDHGMNTSFFTNGGLLNEENARRILECERIYGIVFSVHASTPETYVKIMGLDFDTTKENILRFIRLREEYGREKTLDLGITFVRNELNMYEVQDYIEMWKPHFENPSNYEMVNWNGRVPWLGGYTPVHHRECPVFWSGVPAVDVDGNITLCCYDYFTSPFGSILDLEAVQRYANREFSVELCKNCSARYW